MKALRAVSVGFVAAILVLGVSAGRASAGGMYGWGSAGCCGSAGYGYGGSGYGVYGGWQIVDAGGAWGYGGCGPGGCGAASGDGFWIVGDYTPYIIGHGPMFPAGDFKPAFSYTAPATPDTSVAPIHP